MHPTPSYPITHRCGHPELYASVWTGEKLDRVLQQVAQQDCDDCNRAMHTQTDGTYEDYYRRNRQPEGHAAHRKLRNLTKLWATCQECHDKKVRRLMASKDVHTRRTAAQVAERRGVK